MLHARADYNGRIVDLADPMVLSFMSRVFDVMSVLKQVGRGAITEDDYKAVSGALLEQAEEVLAKMEVIMAFHKDHKPGDIRAIPEDEPVFLIRAQDIVSEKTVTAWAIYHLIHGGTLMLHNSAYAHADLMRQWPRKKVADISEKGAEGQQG